MLLNKTLNAFSIEGKGIISINLILKCYVYNKYKCKQQKQKLNNKLGNI